jgi:hypothetical protein
LRHYLVEFLLAFPVDYRGDAIHDDINHASDVAKHGTRDSRWSTTASLTRQSDEAPRDLRRPSHAPDCWA